MTINTNPAIDKLNDIKVWLKTEEDTFGSGFYCNWSEIEKSFEKDKLITFSKNDQTIGFICWNTYSYPYAEIDIMEMHPELRGNGYGKKFYKFVEEYFREKNFFAIKLFCAPAESEIFWKKMGFQKFPKRGYGESELTYYKPLLETNKLTEHTEGDKVELWDLEPYQVKEQKAKWTWGISKESPPIIHPVNSDWNLRLTKGGKILIEDKVKKFDIIDDIFYGPFLFIDTGKYFDET